LTLSLDRMRGAACWRSLAMLVSAFGLMLSAIHVDSHLVDSAHAAMWTYGPKSCAAWARFIPKRNAGHRRCVTHAEYLSDRRKMDHELSSQHREYAQYGALACVGRLLGTFARLPFWLYPHDLTLRDGSRDPRAGKLNVMKALSELAGASRRSQPWL